jgi:hypothetical protein
MAIILNQMVKDMKESMNENGDGKGNVEPFTNSFEFNQTCLLLTILFLFLFVYKKEVIKFFN